MCFNVGKRMTNCHPRSTMIKIQRVQRANAVSRESSKNALNRRIKRAICSFRGGHRSILFRTMSSDAEKNTERGDSSRNIVDSLFLSPPYIAAMHPYFTPRSFLFVSRHVRASFYQMRSIVTGNLSVFLLL